MYIAPQGTIKLLRNVPLEPSYEHTIYFNSAAEQARWFEGKAKYTLTNQYYSRKGRGVLRIKKKFEELTDCNYVMFKNDGFVEPQYTKWYYAFITDIEYLNNNVTLVSFEIDVMQTYFFDYQLGESFVEREHSATDATGDNIVEENISIGEYAYNSVGLIPHFSNYSLVIASGCKPIFGESGWGPPVDSDPGFYNGLFAGVEYLSYDLDNDPDAMAKIDGVLHAIKEAGRTDEVIAIYMMPTDFITSRSDTPSLTPTVYDVTMPTLVRAWNYKYNGSTHPVRNKKLYTYPFSAIYIASSDGTSAIYRAEYFKESATFRLEGAMGCPPQIQLTPLDYNLTNASGTRIPNYNESILLNNYPMCSWTTDTYKAWLAQNKGRIALGTASIVAGAALSAVTQTTMAYPPSEPTPIGNILGHELANPIDQFSGRTIMPNSPPTPTEITSYPFAREGKYLLGGGLASITHNIGSALQYQAMPNQVQGVERGIISLSTRELGFHFYDMRVRDDYAAIIDSYFDRFGYATKMTKIPNRNVRPHWCYTKTIDCNIINANTGGVPGSAAELIKRIYDKGITFWKNGDEVGNYSLDNSPVSNP